jgi:hypothetical protein
MKTYDLYLFPLLRVANAESGAALRGKAHVEEGPYGGAWRARVNRCGPGGALESLTPMSMAEPVSPSDRDMRPEEAFSLGSLSSPTQ